MPSACLSSWIFSIARPPTFTFGWLNLSTGKQSWLANLHDHLEMFLPHVKIRFGAACWSQKNASFVHCPYHWTNSESITCSSYTAIEAENAPLPLLTRQKTFCPGRSLSNLCSFSDKNTFKYLKKTIVDNHIKRYIQNFIISRLS
jgi:hypothetical protein